MSRVKAEQHFADLRRYPRAGGTPQDVIDQIKQERGYLDLDDPEQKRKYVSGAKDRFNPVIDGDRKAGIKKAKAAHKQALKNLQKAGAKTVQKEKRPEGDRIKEVQSAMLAEVCDKVKAGNVNLSEVIAELQEMRMIGLKMAYREFERVAASHGLTVSQVVGSNVRH